MRNASPDVTNVNDKDLVQKTRFYVLQSELEILIEIINKYLQTKRKMCKRSTYIF